MKKENHPSKTSPRVVVSVCAAFAAAMSLLFSGCGRGEATDALEAARARGTLRVAVEGVYPPWNFHDDSGALTGFDVELAKAVAQKLGLRAEFTETAWDGIFAGLDAGRWDAVFNEVEPNPEREAAYDFSDPYAAVRTVAIVRAGDEGKFSGPADLKGKTTANSITSTYAAIARENGANPIPVDTIDETIRLLLDGRIDATLNSNLSFLEYKGHHPEAPVTVAFELPDATPVAVPFAKGDRTATLRLAVNAAIAQLREEGVLSALSERFLGADVTR